MPMSDSQYDQCLSEAEETVRVNAEWGIRPCPGKIRTVAELAYALGMQTERDIHDKRQAALSEACAEAEKQLDAIRRMILGEGVDEDYEAMVADVGLRKEG